jgi:hypothetical protein
MDCSHAGRGRSPVLSKAQDAGPGPASIDCLEEDLSAPSPGHAHGVMRVMMMELRAGHCGLILHDEDRRGKESANKGSFTA